MMKRTLSMILIAAMLVSLFGCAAQPVQAPKAEQLQTKEENTVSEAVDEMTREEKEQVVEILGEETDKEELPQLSDEELDIKVENLVSKLEQEEPEVQQSQTDVTENDEDSVYDENGAMKEPYDQVYPEDIENGTVTFDEETLLIKLSNSLEGKITDGMAAAGVAALDEIVPMEKATWYEAKLVDGTDATVAIEALRQLKEVQLVEYNFQIQTSAIDSYKDFDHDHDFGGNHHHKDQWHMHHCGIPDGMTQMQTDGGSSSVIVAVIDSGVDYDHEDLAQNMWVNSAEIPDNNIDDDGNGYVDDYYGVNIVAGKGNGDDDNGHGTHVAGIIAARNNNLGVVGIAYNVKIMTVKAAMASGALNQSDIAKAILYAYEMGAEVINMSFGGTACSIAVQDALSIAYSRCVLVASAGNDSMPNEATDNYLPRPNYPAALTYVLGVMSVNQYGVESSFTNWDAYPFNGVEYELYAPGDEIMSTLPGDRYGVLSGTSMAAPVVSAIAAILRSEFADRDMYPTKFIYGQLCSTSGYCATCLDPEDHAVNGECHAMAQIVNLYDALTKLPKPEVNMQDYSAFDTETIAEGNNGDGVIDAGETIALGLTLRNRWGMSENTIVTIDALSSVGIADPYVTIQNPSVNYGSVGTYSTQNCGAIYTDELLTGWEDPFYITIAKDCPNDYIIKLNVTITCENALDAEDTATYTATAAIWLYVRNGVVLPSVIDEDMVLTADNLYIIPNSTVIQSGVTVRVEPGTHIQFWSADAEDPYADQYVAYLLVLGNFIVEGTKEKPVYIYPSDLMSEYIVEIGADDSGYISMVYADVTNLSAHNSHNTKTGNTINYVEHCTFRYNYPTTLLYRYVSGGTVKTTRLMTNSWLAQFDRAVDCVFYKIAAGSSTNNYTPDVCGRFERCIFVDCSFKLSSNTSAAYCNNCVFLGNHCADGDVISGSYSPGTHYLGTRRMYNSSTDTTYVEASIHMLPFFQSLGGGYAVVETATEQQWLQSQVSTGSYGSYNVGIHYDPDLEQHVWSDGTKIGDFIDINGAADDKYPGQFPIIMYFASSSSSYIMKSDYYSENDSLFEIPGDCGDAIDAMYEQHYNGYFYNNAILNRISTDTDVNHWMRIIAPSYDYYNETSLGSNYWGTTNETAIGLQIVDYADFISYFRIMYEPYLTEAPENTFPFVTSVTVLNKVGEEVRIVGNETITVRVTFNRDMDTTIPLSVKFGSAEPYGDYIIPGSYVDPRTWEGTYTLNTLIENGVQYWNISNGCSATDDLALYADTARFFFNIDTTAAQALIMQGNATETGIQLTWTQDDFDTLMGYNIYRSTSEDGYYQRLNSTVIPADTMEWFDDTVEPGVRYYYNFTVVKTDLTESEPSGKITIMSMDTMAPNIYHSPVYSAFTGSNLIISATVTDNLYIAGATVYFRTVGDTEWHSVSMTNNNSKYSAIIPAEYLTTAGLEYYIEAFDGVSYTYKGSTEMPYTVTIQQAIDQNSMGDVNGDGVITNLDALMLLQAINDLLNLTAEQFARADLNGDGELSASEALRILQYVSGAVGDLIMP